MSLDHRTIVVTQISAAVACNALAALRLAITEALSLGMKPEEIREVLSLTKSIQEQPISHVREPKQSTHEHRAHCTCGTHHA